MNYDLWEILYFRIKIQQMKIAAPAYWKNLKTQKHYLAKVMVNGYERLNVSQPWRHDMAQTTCYVVVVMRHYFSERDYMSHNV